MEPQYMNLIFEIQVRTVFQDAWAVISHTKRYKYYGFMPEKIKRNINLFSGTLELLDNTLDDLVTEMLNIQINISKNLGIIEDKFESF
jgi:ppGpp synthetase/RelA/SpoT-type nucleotidyltranferase